MKKVTLNINGCLPQVHDGKDGKDGKDGVDGKSAYQIWLDNGNTGSEAEFLESLKGPKGTDGVIGKDGAVGPKGDKGEKGDKGDKGDTGDTGPQGPQGLQGEVGPQGPQGVEGPKGERGDMGVRGPQGEKGDSLFEDAKVEEGKLIIIKPDGSKLEVPVPTCPDVLFVDAFDKVELGYSHSTTCDKSEVEPEPKTEEPIVKRDQITLNTEFATDEEGISVDNVNPSYVVFKLSDFKAPATATDSPLTAKLVIRNVAQNSQRVVSEDVYTTTIPTGKTYASVPYISHSYTELAGKAADGDISILTIYELTVENYLGKYVVTTMNKPTNFQPINRL